MFIACGLFRDGDGRPQVTWFANDEWARDPLQEGAGALTKGRSGDERPAAAAPRSG
ncbi:MAG: hypothetical protein HOL51_27340 [Gemmatimonadetes bacterium]|nr:hypothetical protein [Gemmatimonadota bacterium]MBT5800726.1 hypothetical protein [Gemmatimonadota bacterium]MBT6621286.1 hypothetical protein [Gemmatimonadota bacterium]MBT7419620.1 hypothetical protein [Gemmatimonadota bacterium]MBT7547703.1 hypothetical protein [Gemmatimonadota bacterium]